MTNKNYHHGDLKSDLIQKGLMILDKEGYGGFSLRKVAKACNVSQTAPYRHFKDKDALIAAIASKATRAFNENLHQATLVYPDDPKKQLKQMGIAYIRFFSKNPEYLRLFFLSDVLYKMGDIEDGDFHDMCSAESHFISGHPFGTFYDAVRRYAAASPGQTMEENELLLYCWGLVHGISVLISQKEKPLSQDDYLLLADKIIWNEDFLK